MRTSTTSLKEHSTHAVQFYGANDRQLTASVGRYVAEGLASGDGVLIVASEAHIKAFAEEVTRLGVVSEAAVKQRRLVFLDAETTLADMLLEERIEWALFETTITSALRRLRARRRSNHTGIRVYGELVALLWQSGMMSTAIQLEHYWNRLKDSIAFDLFCGYPITRTNDSDVRAIMAAHTHVVPAPVSEISMMQRREDVAGELSTESA